ncbi:MAG TPA: trypsin-like peptidase domain-containing protein [Gemmatimonadales bacterium]|nr:trypsin-like peptidase domain-containing protein [Gemmatimonadales bacterium]
MKCELEVISGARAGHRDTFDKSYIGIGRHPMSDLRFDAEKDLDASARHAAVLRQGDTYILRDLGSTNGTFVNGEKLSGDRSLNDGDTLRFGHHGPEVVFRIIRESHDEVVMKAMKPPEPAQQPAARSASPPQAAPAPAAPAVTAAPAGTSATSILRAEIREQRGRFRALVAMLAIVLIGAFFVIVWQNRRSSQDLATTVAVIDSLRVELDSIRAIQARTDSQASRLRQLLATERNPGRVRQLRQELTLVENRSQNLAQVAAVNWNAVVRSNRAGVAIIFVRFPDSSMWSGTAFGVTPSGLMITNRHLVVNNQGQRAAEVAVQFSGSLEVHPARVERVSPSSDIAVLRLESTGPHPVVSGISTTPPEEGDPIALIGFPLGLDMPHGQAPTAGLYTGSVSRIIADSLLQLDAWSGTGASGSPIFDRNGRVVGVEFGGQRDTGGRVVFGLPISRAMALLPAGGN